MHNQLVLSKIKLMKHLYSLVFVLVTLTGLNPGFAQIIPNVTTTNDNTFSCSGTASAAPTGGTGIYSYVWSTGETTSSISGLCSGSYSVYITDSNQDTVSYNFLITNPCSNLVLSATTLTNCTPGNCDGSVQLTVTGGSGPYVFSTSGLPQTGQSLFTSLCPGAYLFSVVDINGCSATATAVVIDPSMNPIIANLTTTDDSTGTCSGFASVSPTGGVAPYTVIWSNNVTGNSAYNLCSGNYMVAIWDSNGDSTVVSFTISSPCSNIALTASVINCTPGNCDGAIQANATGGAAPYTFSIGGAPQGPGSLFSNLCPGIYSIICMDAVGCSTAPLTVPVSDTSQNACSSFAAYITSTPASGPASCDGTITVNVFNGTAPYSYAWSIGTTTAANFNLCTGTYSVVCTDANGCQVTATGTVSDSTVTPSMISANLTTQDDYTNNCSGSASVAPAGGTAPYLVYWSTGETGNSIDSLCAGFYTVYVMDVTNTDTVAVDFIITDSSSTYSNNPYPNSVINDTLYSGLVSNCIIDYTAIDSASLYQAVYDSINNNLYVTWAIYSPTDTVYISDTLGWAGNPGGYYSLTISVFCPNKSGNDFFKIEQVIYFDGSQVWLTPALGLDEKELLNQVVIYPNPFSNTITVDNKDGAITSLKLIDLNGRVLSEMQPVNSGLVEMGQLEAISSGTYLLILSGENASKTCKVIK